MSKQVFVNLPVADLPKSLAFFQALGFSRNPQFSDDTGACIVISETIFVMLLTHGFAHLGKRGAYPRIFRCKLAKLSRHPETNPCSR